MQGKQQQSAIPITQAKATQKMAKNTSNARNTTASLQSTLWKKHTFSSKLHAHTCIYKIKNKNKTKNKHTFLKYECQKKIVGYWEKIALHKKVYKSPGFICRQCILC